MNRTDAVIAIDDAAASLDKAIAILSSLGCTYSMEARIAAIVAGLDALRVDVAQCDLPGETD
jgi:hypothetical protein